MQKYQISDSEIFCKIVFNELLKFNVHFNIHLIFKPNMPWLVFCVDRHASLMRFLKVNESSTICIKWKISQNLSVLFLNIINALFPHIVFMTHRILYFWPSPKNHILSKAPPG